MESNALIEADLIQQLQPLHTGRVLVVDWVPFSIEAAVIPGIALVYELEELGVEGLVQNRRHALTLTPVHGVDDHIECGVHVEISRLEKAGPRCTYVYKRGAMAGIFRPRHVRQASRGGM